MNRILSTGSALLAAAASFFLAGTARADFCAGKANGLWCDGGVLRNCKNGSIFSSQTCQCGCTSMPPGVDDACTACGGDFCSGKGNGDYCDGGALKTCSNGVTSNTQSCQCGCSVMPPGVPDVCTSCGSDFCGGKGNGDYCDGGALKTCSNGVTSNTQACQCGCTAMPPGVPDVCTTCGGGDFCSGKLDGAWCNNGSLVQCGSGKTTSSQPCPNGCTNMPAGVPDECAAASGFCAGKSDGSYCDNSSLVECSAGAQVAVQQCPTGCTIMPGNLPDVCNASGGDPGGGFCADKTDGAWCNGDLLVSCKGGSIQTSINCPDGCQSKPAGQNDVCVISSPNVPPGQSVTATDVNGCAVFSGSIDLYKGKGLPVFNQLSYKQQLGTCGDATIASDGCAITSLSMLYAYLNMSHTVGGQTGMDPAIENAWRSEVVNGAQRGYANGCWAMWYVNPPQLAVAQKHSNPSVCLSGPDGQTIANSLNSGMPVIMGVHWDASCVDSSCFDRHWVLVVGADEKGLIINDPYGGKASVHMDVHNPPYIVDDYYTYSLVGIGSGGDSSIALDEYGNPLGKGEGIASPPTLPGPLDGPNAADPKSTSEGSGCSLGGAGSLASGASLLSALLLLMSRRSRKSSSKGASA